LTVARSGENNCKDWSCCIWTLAATDQKLSGLTLIKRRHESTCLGGPPDRDRVRHESIYRPAASFAIIASIMGLETWRKLPVSLTELCINTTLRCGQSFRYHLSLLGTDLTRTDGRSPRTANGLARCMAGYSVLSRTRSISTTGPSSQHPPS
jgi:hypothetical protein